MGIEIPRLTPQATITDQPLAPRISQSLFAGPAIAMEQIGKTISDLSQKFEDLQTLHESTEAENIARKRLRDLQLEASTTDDIFDKDKKFPAALSKIREEAGVGITLPAAKAKFAGAFERVAMDADFKIKSILRTRQIDSMKEILLENIDQLADATDRDTQLKNKLDEAVKGLVITGEQRFKLREATKKDWQESDIRNAIATDAMGAKEDILAGIFGELSADETSKWLDVADKKIKRNEKEAEIIRDTRHLVNGGNLIANLQGTSVEDIIQSVIRDEINAGLANDLIQWKTEEGTVQYEGDKKVWLEIVRDSLKPEQDLRLFQNRIAKAIADKEIQAVEGANLSVKVKELFDKAIEFKAPKSRLNQAFTTAMDLIKTASPDLAINFFMVKELFKRVEKKNIPEDQIENEAKKIINEDVKERSPNIVNFGEKGQLMIDAQGNKARVFPDGSIEEVE